MGSASLSDCVVFLCCIEFDFIRLIWVRQTALSFVFWFLFTTIFHFNRLLCGRVNTNDERDGWDTLIDTEHLEQNNYVFRGFVFYIFFLLIASKRWAGHRKWLNIVQMGFNGQNIWAHRNWIPNMNVRVLFISFSIFILLRKKLVFCYGFYCPCCPIRIRLLIWNDGQCVLGVFLFMLLLFRFGIYV